VNTGFWQFMLEHREEIGVQTVEHLGLTLTALAAASLAGIPTGLLLTRWKRFSGPALAFVGVIQTIPSLALLGFLLPWLGIGVIPAIVALFLYALLPIVRNTYIGVEEVDPAVKEAARGMGMTGFQMLARVELPLAAPVIFAGVRTATVIGVGVATLSALIGSGGLGEFIFRGIALNNPHMILAGAMPAAMLAMGLDALLAWIQPRIRRLLKPFAIVFALTSIALVPMVIVPAFTGTGFLAAFPTEFMERADGYRAMSQIYDLELETTEMDVGLMYQALKEGQVDLISGFSTDGRIQAFDLQVLEDDKHYFPPYEAAPLINGETLRRHPEISEALNLVSGKISNFEMAQMNFRVDEDHATPRQVAKDFLESLGLQTSMDREEEPTIVIGSKSFTEQFVLAEIIGLLIENQTGLSVELTTGLAGTQICFEALVAGEIDVYPEYTGTGLLVLLDTDDNTRERILRDPDQVYEHVRSEQARISDVHWLAPFGFNNTYALMMRRKDSEQFGIRTISDLQPFLRSRRPAK
jgi:osmoprotectant transport system permease protein